MGTKMGSGNTGVSHGIEVNLTKSMPSVRLVFCGETVPRPTYCLTFKRRNGVCGCLSRENTQSSKWPDIQAFTYRNKSGVFSANVHLALISILESVSDCQTGLEVERHWAGSLGA